MKQIKLSRVKIFIAAALFIFSLNSFALQIENTEFKIKLPTTLDGIELSAKKIKLISELVYPELLDGIDGKDNWEYKSRNIESKTLAGVEGKLTSDIFENGSLRLTREFWTSIFNDEIAVRQKATNLNSSPIRLKSLAPLRLNGKSSLKFISEPDAKKWNVLLQKRLKNGKPISINPSSNETVEADPFCLFTSNSQDTPDLLIGYLSQKDHLARLLLKFDSLQQGISFNSLTAECEFDGVKVPAGGERSSQWVYIKTGFDANKLIEEYADRVGNYHGVSKPSKPAPTVFCTWYFHGRDYNEEYFMDDINALKKNRMPIDVFLIDDCWANGNWGYWTTSSEFPSGMKKITDKIKENGYRPGIWTAPFSAGMNTKITKDHPEWLLRTSEDSLVVFGYAVKSWILDPTYPGVTDHLEEVFRRLKNDYGFTYFKFDFMRSVFVFDNIKFYDPHVTRLEAYQMGLEAIRRGVGPEAYISVCGGHFGGSLGIANSQRSGSDVVSMWEPNQIDCFRQNILRTWMSRLWHVDPDALMIRKRDQPFHDPAKRHAKLALGKLTNEEAMTFTLNQYVGGGMVCFSEYLKELHHERRELYKHIIPSINMPSKPLDIYNTFCPTRMLTEVKPVCESLDPWNTIAISNWQDQEMDVKIVLDQDVIGSLKSDKFIVSEFFNQKTLGIYSKNETVDLGKVPPHHSRLLRIAPWNGTSPVLTSTDLHFSGGGVEIEEWKYSNNTVEGTIKTEWNYPVNISVAFPANNEAGYILKTALIPSGQKLFYISN